MKYLSSATIRPIALIIFSLIGCGTDDTDLDPKSENLPENKWSRDNQNSVISNQTTDGVAITNISDPAVLFDDAKFKLWAGCVGTDNNFAFICYSESVDGSNWTDLQIIFEPAADANAWDNQKTEVPTVVKDENEPDQSKRYKMWYGGSNKSAPDLTKIGLAYSADGISWERLETSSSLNNEKGMVIEPGFTIGDAGVVSDPTAYILDDAYHLWYNSFGSNNDILISHATSDNGYQWVKDSSNPIMTPNSDWENGGPGDISADVSHPVVIRDHTTGKFLMWYGSFDESIFEIYNGLGFAYSEDGSTWTKDPGNPIFLPDTSMPGEEIGISTGPAVVYQTGIYHLFYSAANNDGLRVINHATSN